MGEPIAARKFPKGLWHHTTNWKLNLIWCTWVFGLVLLHTFAPSHVKHMMNMSEVEETVLRYLLFLFIWFYRSRLLTWEADLLFHFILVRNETEPSATLSSRYKDAALGHDHSAFRNIRCLFVIVILRPSLFNCKNKYFTATNIQVTFILQHFIGK